MRTEIFRSEETVGKPFPKIMCGGGGLLVLFRKYNQGTVINPDENHYVGDFSKVWNMDSFTEFDGRVVLIDD